MSKQNPQSATLGTEVKFNFLTSNQGSLRSSPKVNLKRVIQVTQQNDILPQQNNGPLQTQSCLIRCLKCLHHMWKKFQKVETLQIDIKEAKIIETIQELKNKKPKGLPLLSSQSDFKKVLVLGLDETLVKTTFTKPSKYDFESEICFNGHMVKIYTHTRFGLDNFLFEMSKIYELVLFTQSPKAYADKIIKFIDPKQRISHKLYRQHCLVINKTHYLKSIRNLGRPLKDIVIVDSNANSSLLQPSNFYQIESYQGSCKDRQLFRLASFLKHIATIERVTSITAERKAFENMEIPLKEKDSSIIPFPQSRTLQEKKMQYHHNKINSELQCLQVKPDSKNEQTETSVRDLVSHS